MRYEQRWLGGPGSVQDADGARWAGCGGKPPVCGDQFTPEVLCQCDVAGVIGADVGAQLKRAAHESKCRDTLEVELLEVANGGTEPFLGQCATEPALSQHRDRFYVDQVWGGDLPGSPQVPAGGGSGGLIVGEGVG